MMIGFMNQEQALLMDIWWGYNIFLEILGTVLLSFYTSAGFTLVRHFYISSQYYCSLPGIAGHEGFLVSMNLIMTP